MKFDKNMVAAIIESQFQDDLYNQISNLVADLDDAYLSELFDSYIDYVELSQIVEANVVCVEQESEIAYSIVCGILEVEIDLAGYSVNGNRYTFLENSTVTLELEFNFIHEKTNYRFEIIEGNFI